MLFLKKIINLRLYKKCLVQNTNTKIQKPPIHFLSLLYFKYTPVFLAKQLKTLPSQSVTKKISKKIAASSELQHD